MSAARTSSACCCVCPPQSCCCDCLQVSTDITITGSVDVQNLEADDWCGSSPGSISSLERTQEASIVGTGNLIAIMDVADPHKRQHKASFNENSPYSNGNLFGSMSISGSGEGEFKQEQYTGTVLTYRNSGEYSITWQSVTGEVLTEVGGGLYIWNVDNTNNSYNCDTDDCRLLVSSFINCTILIEQSFTGFTRLEEWDNAGDSTYDETANYLETSFLTVPINVKIRYPGEYRDCEQALSSGNYQVVESSIGNILQMIEVFPIPNPSSVYGTLAIQDACDGGISNQDKQLGVAQRVYSDVEDGTCDASKISSRNYSTNNIATIKHDIIESLVEGVPCP